MICCLLGAPLSTKEAPILNWKLVLENYVGNNARNR